LFGLRQILCTSRWWAQTTKTSQTQNDLGEHIITTSRGIILTNQRMTVGWVEDHVLDGKAVTGKLLNGEA
jgi:hypothetical protein